MTSYNKSKIQCKNCTDFMTLCDRTLICSKCKYEKGWKEENKV